ncbi:ABC transporter substrate-binding protein [Rhodovulum sulfidophilum]|uniref:ABC transporter substrate-binding protein n=1 Tax=Rhodovulum sulfidophilum TaxID=35806 RepID=UPI000952B0CC|nr:ABC transporter substrate-binding protein [Rhodovulum sulfidophilum]MBK5923895.1 ABC transporter substrate-binding protein [Rhodovulum sulfidophilum]MBL3563736.1 ABC transporter substrate-binding protein [Rhodovulum sulfidophilum]MBL3595338.1 ABC transporter substrate-binding protein [Rhodovulum sulfidophilum]OLS50985.1 ABC transporter substrate-binding protein [Rhodovulum sulfidophilum]
MLTLRPNIRGTRRLAAALLAGGALLAPAASFADTTITAVMHSSLRVLDPVITTAHITRDHAYMIYDVLTAVDENFQPQPQMADWTVSDDKLTYTFTLRDGLKFHDGAPVTATDVVASLERWGKRDSGGQMIFDVTASLTAADDKTVVWTLASPFPPLLNVISKQSALPPFIMPARIAATSPDETITEYVGSGPFVFNTDAYEPGVSATYDKFEDYVPRDEPPSWMAGGKVVNVDHVVWTTMPDNLTAINALANGEIDYIEQIQVDLKPILDASPDVTVEMRDPLGYVTIGRPNFLYPPFDNKKVRQAALLALSQEDVLATMMGSPEYYTICGAIFGCGTPLADETGSEPITSGAHPDEARALLEEAGYDGTPVVLMQPTDVVSLTNQPVVAAQALRNAGFNVDMQAMDWQSVVQRRAQQSPPDEGGWNLFFTNWMIPEISDPLINVMVNGRGDDAWFGWPDDPEIEALRSDFAQAPDDAARKAAASKIQAHVMDNVNYIHLGEYAMPQARRDVIDDMIQSPVPVFWNITKDGE